MFQMPISSPMMKTMLGLDPGPFGGACATAGGTVNAPQSIVPLQASVISFLSFITVSLGCISGSYGHGLRNLPAGLTLDGRHIRARHPKETGEGCLTRKDRRISDDDNQGLDCGIRGWITFIWLRSDQ